MEENTTPKNFWHYIAILKSWKRFLLLNIFGITIVALIVSFLLPVYYYSFAVIKPSDESNLNLFSAVLGSKGLAGIGKSLNVGGLQYSDLDYYQALLGSRKITIDVINKFNLKKTYNQKYLFKTINELIGNTEVSSDAKSNILVLGVYDKDPKRAQKITQSYLELLNNFINEIKSVSSKTNRDFIEERYIKNREELSIAENNLKLFQKKNKIILPEEQFSATVKAIAEIEAQKLLLESELNVLRSSFDENSPIILNLKNQLETFEKKISEISSRTDFDDDTKIFLSLNKAPDIVGEYLTLYREVEIQNQILEYIYPLYEQAKLESEKITPAFVVIDEPFLPEYKTKPKRIVIVLGAFIFSLLISMFYALLHEKIKSLRMDYQKHNSVK